METTISVLPYLGLGNIIVWVFLHIIVLFFRHLKSIRLLYNKMHINMLYDYLFSSVILNSYITFFLCESQ